jgi:uncharacterized integral membrane protein
MLSLTHRNTHTHFHTHTHTHEHTHTMHTGHRFQQHPAPASTHPRGRLRGCPKGQRRLQAHRYRQSPRQARCWGALHSGCAAGRGLLVRVVCCSPLLCVCVCGRVCACVCVCAFYCVWGVCACVGCGVEYVDVGVGVGIRHHGKRAAGGHYTANMQQAEGCWCVWFAVLLFCVCVCVCVCVCACALFMRVGCVSCGVWGRVCGCGCGYPPPWQARCRGHYTANMQQAEGCWCVWFAVLLFCVCVCACVCWFAVLYFACMLGV